MTEPLFRKLDCYMLRADDFEAATAFYRDRLGHPLLWRTDDAIAFGLPESDAELVVHRALGPEANLLVGDADQAYRQLIDAGATPIEQPFDIAIGRCAVVRDPFGNRLVVLDQSKGRLVTDAAHNVIDVRR